ncbi:MAG: zinc-dependent alcohol dehydrogenase [Candidatus Dormibacteria bacterium]
MSISPQVRAAVVGATPRSGTADVDVREIPLPSPHAPGWVVLRPTLSGICGSDLDMLRGARGRTIAAREPQGVVPGHELVGIVSDARGTHWVREGQRVLVEPTLRCVHKGLPDCSRCRAGEGHLCENVDRSGPLCGGESVGFSARTGGGWSEALLVHEDMLLPADGLSDQRAVLAEPAASALHAVMRWQRRGDRAVVIGTGPVSRLCVATLARLHPGLDISVVYDGRGKPRTRFGRRRRAMPGHALANPDADAAAIREMGAARVWRGPPEWIVDQAAELTRARRMHRDDDALPLLDRGVDVVFDCRGTSASVNLALHMLRGGGSLVLAQRPGRIDVDWSLVWSREISVLGSSSYGRESNGLRTFAVIRDWLGDPAFPIDDMVTHRFRLEEVGAAITTAAAGTAVGAVKVVIEGGGSPLRDSIAQPDGIGAAETDEPVLLHVAAKRVQSVRNAANDRD